MGIVFKDPLPKNKSVENISKQLQLRHLNIPVQDCDGSTYVDKDTSFSIECPKGLKVYTYKNEVNRTTGEHEKIAFLCEDVITLDANSSFYRCPSGRVMVWMNGDGWGGACPEENIQPALVNGQTVQACVTNTSIRGVYPKSGNENRYRIVGSFSSTFPKDTALKVIETFKTL